MPQEWLVLQPPQELKLATSAQVLSTCHSKGVMSVPPVGTATVGTQRSGTLMWNRLILSNRPGFGEKGLLLGAGATGCHVFWWQRSGVESSPVRTKGVRWVEMLQTQSLMFPKQLHRFYFLRFYLFIFREWGREEGREASISCPLTTPLGTWPTTQACALAESGTTNLRVWRPTLGP